MTGDLAKGGPRSFTFGPFVLVPERQLLLKNDEPVRIGGRALDILTALVERSGELVSKRELFSRAWPETFVDEGNLKVNIAALRRALGDEPSQVKYIATVIGRGYRFVAPVLSRQAASLATAPSALAGAHSLPTVATRIFGRTDAIDAIRSDLCETRLVSIVGAGGVGKTTVAIAAAHAAVQERADGAAFIDLATISDPQFVPAAIAYALGLGLTGGDPLSSVERAISLQQKVLLFDNCEHLLPAVAAAVDRIARHLDDVRILTTSREPLRIRGERVHRLRGLECDPSERPVAEEARRFPAIELFAERAAERSGYRLTDSDAPAVAEICRRLDGNALAIELAATQTAAFPPGVILQMLDDSFRILRLGPALAPLRQQSLLATLDWSYGLLLECEATLLRQISVFAGAFTEDGATAVSNGSLAEVLGWLAQLAAKSLVAMEINNGLVTYRLLETTRVYCLERLRLGGEDETVRCRHAAYVCAVLEKAASEWSQRPSGEWGAAYGRIIGDLHSALTWTGGSPTNRSLRIRLTAAGLLLWNHFSLTEECRIHVSRAVEELDAAGLAGTAIEMKLKLWLGGATMLTRGLEPQALAAIRRALEIAVQTDDTDYRLRCLSMIGIYELFTGEHDLGLRTLECFSSVAAAHDPSALPEGEVHSAIAELLLGRLQNALQRLEPLRHRDLRYFTGSYGVRYMFDTIVLLESALSHVQWLTGFPDTSSRTAAAAMERARPTQHHLSLNNAFAYACAIFYWSGRYEDCGRCVAMLDEHVARHGLVTRRPVASFYRAALACRKSDHSCESVDELKRAIDEFHSVNCLARIPYYLSVLAEALLYSGRLVDAETTILAAIDRGRAQNEQWCVPEQLRIQAAIFAASERRREAEEALIESMAIAREIGALSWRLRAANDLASLWFLQSRADEARSMLEPIYNEFTEGFATRDLVVATNLLASVPPDQVGQA